MKYLDLNPVFMEPTEFLRSLHGKRLRWELPNDCTHWKGDLDASMSVKEAPTGRIALSIFGGIVMRPVGSQPPIPPGPYKLYLTPEAVALIQPDAGPHPRADFCAIAPARVPPSADAT